MCQIYNCKAYFKYEIAKVKNTLYIFVLYNPFMHYIYMHGIYIIMKFIVINILFKIE